MNATMDEQDIVRDCSNIFFELFQEFPQDKITDLPTLDLFLGQLLHRTKGLVIVDFLDSGNWDCFGSFAIDHEQEYLFLHWHHYSGTNDIASFVSSTGYKPRVDVLMLHFKELCIERNRTFPFVAIRGYALKEREVLQYLKKIDPKTNYVKDEKANFFTLFQMDLGSYFQECFCHDTPIYSILLIPKDTADNTELSMKVLFLYNYNDCETRLQKTGHSLQYQHLDEDELCEKANTIRRIFEFVLKIECCYHRHLNTEVIWGEEFDAHDFVFKDSYSDLKLGILSKILNPVKTEEEKQTLNKIIRLANELSHDSGKKVTKEKVEDLLKTTISYIDKLTDLIYKS